MSDVHVPSVRGLVAALAALLALTALTVFVAFVDLGRWNGFCALLIASFKALLIALCFMHVRRAEPVVWVFAGIGIAWLLLLLGLTVADFDARLILAGWAE